MLTLSTQPCFAGFVPQACILLSALAAPGALAAPPTPRVPLKNKLNHIDYLFVLQDTNGRSGYMEKIHLVSRSSYGAIIQIFLMVS